MTVLTPGWTAPSGPNHTAHETWDIRTVVPTATRGEARAVNLRWGRGAGSSGTVRTPRGRSGSLWPGCARGGGGGGTRRGQQSPRGAFGPCALSHGLCPHGRRDDHPHGTEKLGLEEGVVSATATAQTSRTGSEAAVPPVSGPGRLGRPGGRPGPAPLH